MEIFRCLHYMFRFFKMGWMSSLLEFFASNFLRKNCKNLHVNESLPGVQRFNTVGALCGVLPVRLSRFYQGKV